jgi:hypothetical protein
MKRNMTKKNHIQQEIEKTLQSLDGAERAEANPFLFTRIRARMQRQRGWERITSFMMRPVIAFSVLFLIISVNAFVLFRSENNTAGAESITAADLTDEYSIASVNDYDYENTESK